MVWLSFVSIFAPYAKVKLSYETALIDELCVYKVVRPMDALAIETLKCLMLKKSTLSKGTTKRYSFVCTLVLIYRVLEQVFSYFIDNDPNSTFFFGFIE